MESSFDHFLSYYQKYGKYPIQKIESSYYSNGIWTRIKAIFEIKKRAGEVNHITGDVHFLTFGLPKKRTILTIHDCGFMQHPSAVARFILKLLWLKLPEKNCEYITTVSEVTRQEVIKYTNCSPEKVVVIPTLIQPFFQRVDKPFNNLKPRILHIGLKPNKNFARHVQAIAGLACHFHIIGKLKKEHFSLLETYQIDYSYQHNISDAAMLQAYIDADIMLFASTFEGFGMPIVEAQTIGRVVVTSQLSSMPEIAGDGAIFVNPYEVQSIRSGILNAIEKQEYRQAIIKKGFKNVKRFSVETVAGQYENLYQSLQQ
ncbi:MAG: glycosyltransferase family 4 protein [Saprospiraceae bacterium]